MHGPKYKVAAAVEFLGSRGFLRGAFVKLPLIYPEGTKEEAVRIISMPEIILMFGFYNKIQQVVVLTANNEKVRIPISSLIAEGHITKPAKQNEQ